MQVARLNADTSDTFHARAPEVGRDTLDIAWRAIKVMFSLKYDTQMNHVVMQRLDRKTDAVHVPSLTMNVKL